MTYDVLADRIDQIYPHLLTEVETEDLPKDEKKRRYFQLGTLLVFNREGRINYRIAMRLDHRDADDDDKLAVSLAHEYGHFLCRKLLYPNLFGLGRIIFQILQDRQPYQTPTKLLTNLVILMEETMAWLIAWGILFKMGSLKLTHFEYGWHCWKSYWKRMKPWVKKN